MQQQEFVRVMNSVWLANTIWLQVVNFIEFDPRKTQLSNLQEAIFS